MPARPICWATRPASLDAQLPQSTPDLPWAPASFVNPSLDSVRWAVGNFSTHRTLGLSTTWDYPQSIITVVTVVKSCTWTGTKPLQKPWTLHPQNLVKKRSLPIWLPLIGHHLEYMSVGQYYLLPAKDVYNLGGPLSILRFWHLFTCILVVPYRSQVFLYSYNFLGYRFWVSHHPCYRFWVYRFCSQITFSKNDVQPKTTADSQ